MLGGALAGTLALSLAGLVALRHFGPIFGDLATAALLAGVILLATAVLGGLLVRLLLRPIRALESYAVAQATGPADPPRHFGTRETHRTATAVIAMAETLRDRAATVRSFTDHVTHELRSPVSAIRAAVELLDHSGRPAGDSRLLAQIDGAAAGIEAQLTALREMARAREARFLGTATLAEVVPTLAAPLPLTVAGEGVPLPLAPEGLALVLGHLLRNAAEQGAGKAHLDVRVTGEGVALTVADDGPGISPGNAARIFDPFFTTRRDSGGTGMGLAIVAGVLAAHRGRIALVPSGRGATFRIAFPGT